MTITQAEADDLFQLEKHRVDAQLYDYPSIGNSISVPLIAPKTKDEFLLDITRGSVSMKVSHQNRYQKTVILARLDLIGAPHQNPDGTRINTPHVHLYREGYNDKWAIELPPNTFSDLNNLLQTLQDFMTFCNVTVQPNFNSRMF